MLARRPAGHVEANLTDDLQSAEAVDSINLGQVDPRHRIEIGVDVKTRGITLARTPFAYRSRQRRSNLRFRNKRLETRFNLGITPLQLLLNKLILIDGLLQRKE